jgi:hypothetical protein
VELGGESELQLESFVISLLARGTGTLFFIGSLIIGCLAINSCGCTPASITREFNQELHRTVEELYELCHAPGACGTPLECEGKIVLLKGAIDYQNIFDHVRYPRLPYEKFFLGGDENNRVEVLAVSTDNRLLFNRIFTARKEKKPHAFIKGTMVGFDTPVMGNCRREILLEIRTPEDIFFR